MPELPEVETVCRTIAPHVVGRRVLAVDVRERRLRRPIAEDFAQRLVVGAAAVAGALALGLVVGTIAGYGGRVGDELLMRGTDVLLAFPGILLDVGDGMRWVVHLGMSGRFCVGDPPEDLPHVHVVVELEGGVRCASTRRSCRVPTSAIGGSSAAWCRPRSGSGGRRCATR